MTTEQEKRISAIREAQNLRNSIVSLSSYNRDVYDLLEIVDSQAQKIAKLSALFQKAGNGAADLAVKCSEQEMTIAKLTAEIEKLKTNLSAVIATNRQRG